jgi:hypothetical protein
MPDLDQESSGWRLQMLRDAILEGDAEALFCLLTEGHRSLGYINPATLGGEEELQLFEASIAGEEWQVDRLANERATGPADRVMVVLPSESLGLLTREVLHAAVGRARRSLVIVGSRTTLRRALDTPGARDWIG